MTQHPFLKKLLNGQAVEWKPLGEVTQYEQPTKYIVQSKEYHDNFTTPVLTAGKTFILGYTDETNGIYCASEKSVIIFDDFTTANKWVDFDFKVKSSAMKIITSSDENQFVLKYIYYWLNTLPEHDNTDHKRQWISNYSNKKIPIPPLSVQQKIVEILDKFTAITAELNIRNKQYQYYRDKLLTFGDNFDKGHNAHPLYQALSAHWNGEVVWKSLGEVAKKISSGGTPKTGVAEYYNGDIPWLRTQEVNFNEIWDTGTKITKSGMDNSSAKLIPQNCVIIAMYGATVGRVGINKIPLTTNQACANIELDENILNYRYVFYYLSSQYQYIKSLGTGSQTNINAQIVKNLVIPIPPLAVQQKIVEILDKFDTLTHSISQGLPREIELRRKQYEYYREALLLFD